ncbi:MAG: hypothetical protein ABIQ52_15430 [Vicinamibacterales bacterium]
MDLAFIGLAIFVVVMLVKAYLPRKMPGEGKLRDRLSPPLQNFIASLPLPDDHPLANYCTPWKPTEALGNPKAFLPLWQDSEGNPSYYSTYIKLGSKPTFRGLTATENEQAFLGYLVVEVMHRLFKSDRRKAIDLGRRAADAVGFRYFDEATKFLSTWRPQPPEEDEEPEEVEEDAPGDFADRIEEMEKQCR